MEIERATATLLKNMRYNRDILKARETRVSLNSLRKQWLDQQKKIIINQNMIVSVDFYRIPF